MNHMTQPDYADNEVHSGAVNCDCCDKLIFPDDEIWETKKGKSRNKIYAEYGVYTGSREFHPKRTKLKGYQRQNMSSTFNKRR